MLVSKATYTKGNRDGIGFLNVEGEITLKVKASWMYVKGKKNPRLLKIVGTFKSGDGEKVRLIAEKMVKDATIKVKRRWKCEDCEFHTDDIMGLVEYIGPAYNEDGVKYYLCPKCAAKREQTDNLRNGRPDLTEEEIEAMLTSKSRW